MICTPELLCFFVGVGAWGRKKGKKKRKKIKRRKTRASRVVVESWIKKA